VTLSSIVLLTRHSFTGSAFPRWLSFIHSPFIQCFRSVRSWTPVAETWRRVWGGRTNFRGPRFL